MRVCTHACVCVYAFEVIVFEIIKVQKTYAYAKKRKSTTTIIITSEKRMRCETRVKRKDYRIHKQLQDLAVC